MEPDPRVREAASALAAGEAIVLTDDNRSNADGELVIAAQFATAETVGFLVRYGSGFIRAALTLETCLRMQLPPMVPQWPDPSSGDGQLCNFGVAVDAASGITTGISAADRARTLATLADPVSKSDDVRRPGHVQVVKTHPRGVLGWAGCAEAAVDLTRIAGLDPGAGLCTLVSIADPTRMADAGELANFADAHNLRMVSIGDVKAYRSQNGLDLEATQSGRDERAPSAFG